MRNAVRWWKVAVASAGVLALVGCSQKKESAAPPAGERAGRAGRAETEAQSGATEHGGPALTPAGTVAEIWLQVETEQTKLAAAVENNQLKDVHHLAFGIRDLVMALADKAGAEDPAVAPRLVPMVKLVKETVISLDDLASAGNLDGTQGELAKLDSILSGMKAATMKAAIVAP